MIVAGREVDPYLKSGGCNETLQGWKGWLFAPGLIRRHSLLAHLCSLGELSLCEPGFVSSESNYTCGQGRSWIELSHRFDNILSDVYNL